MNNPYYRNYNFNPWNKKIDDCAIRSISIGLGMSYTAVCKALHVAYKNGYGLIRNNGIDLEDIKKTFNDSFDDIVDFSEEAPEDISRIQDEVSKFDIDNDIDTFSSGYTINDFIEEHVGNGSFLIGCISPKKKEGHIVYVNTNKQYFIDTFDCGQFIVDSWMHIKPGARIAQDDPRRLKTKDGRPLP